MRKLIFAQSHTVIRGQSWSLVIDRVAMLLGLLATMTQDLHQLYLYCWMMGDISTFIEAEPRKSEH